MRCNDAKECHLTLSDVIILHAYSIDRYFMAFRELRKKKNNNKKVVRIKITKFRLKEQRF